MRPGTGGQGAAGSNPVIPTGIYAGQRRFRRNPGPPLLRSKPDVRALCVRSAEFALRRAQVLLTRAQRAEQDASLAVATGGSYRASDDGARLTFWRSEVTRLRGEIRVLLAGVR